MKLSAFSDITPLHVAAISLVLAIVILMAFSPISAFAIIALACVIIAVAIYWHQPAWIIYSMLFVAPFHFFITETVLDLPRSSGGLSIGGLFQDIWPLALLAYWLLTAIVSKRFTVAKPVGLIPIIFLIVWSLLHIPSSAPLAGALFGLRNLVRYATIPFILPKLVDNERKINYTFVAMFLGMGVAALISMVEVPGFITLVLSQGSLNLAALPADLRFVGIFRSPEQNATVVSNSFGIALALLAIYGVGKFYTAGRPMRKILYLVLTTILVIFLLLTFSRRGYFTLLLGAFLLLWWWKRSHSYRAKLIVFLGIALVAGLVVLQLTPVGDLVIGRFTERVLNNPSFAGRQQDWQVILDSVMTSSAHFIWGFGLSSTGPVGVRFNVPNAVTAHNYYMLIWHELGVIGLGAFIALLLVATQQGYRIAQRLGTTAHSLNVWFATLIVLLLALNGLLGTTFVAFPNDLYFWTAIGVLTAARQLGRPQQSVGTAPIPEHSKALLVQAPMEYERTETDL